MRRIIISVTNDLVSDQRVNKVAISLTNAGYSVTLLGRELSNSKPLQSRIYNTIRLKLFFTNGVLFYAEYNIRLFFHLLFVNYDILLSNDLDSLPSNFLASKILNKKLVYDSHELFTEVPELVYRKTTQNIWEFIEKLILPRVKYSYTVCESLADYYFDKYGIEMKVVRNLPLCEGKEKEISKKPDRKVILYQGSVNIGRGIDKVISSMKYLSEFDFWVIGSGDEIAQMKEFAIKEGVENNVRFFGKMPFEELHKYTSQASLGISLEENMGLNYYYALPNKIFDYIKCGVPILVSPFPEMSRIVDSYKVGMVAENKYPQELANQIRYMLSDSEERQIWLKNLPFAAKELCWTNEEKTLLSLFN